MEQTLITTCLFLGQVVVPESACSWSRSWCRVCPRLQQTLGQTLHQHRAGPDPRVWSSSRQVLIRKWLIVVQGCPPGPASGTGRYCSGPALTWTRSCLNMRQAHGELLHSVQGKLTCEVACRGAQERASRAPMLRYSRSRLLDVSGCGWVWTTEVHQEQPEWAAGI